MHPYCLGGRSFEVPKYSGPHGLDVQSRRLVIHDHGRVFPVDGWSRPGTDPRGRVRDPLTTMQRLASVRRDGRDDRTYPGPFLPLRI